MRASFSVPADLTLCRWSSLKMVSAVRLRHLFLLQTKRIFMAFNFRLVWICTTFRVSNIERPSGYRILARFACRPYQRSENEDEEKLSSRYFQISRLLVL